jgi:hypothetical protein
MEAIRRMRRRVPAAIATGQSALSLRDIASMLPQFDGEPYQPLPVPVDLFDYHWVKTAQGKERQSESNPTITERIQLKNAAPFSITDIQPTPVRYIHHDGAWFKSSNGADDLPEKTLQVSLRFYGADGECENSSHTWITRMGFHMLHRIMLDPKLPFTLIEMLPLSYERAPMSTKESIGFINEMLLANSSGFLCKDGNIMSYEEADEHFASEAVSDAETEITTTKKTTPRRFVVCLGCDKRFLAKRKNNTTCSPRCQRRALRRAGKADSVSEIRKNAVCETL